MVLMFLDVILFILNIYTIVAFIPINNDHSVPSYHKKSFHRRRSFSLNVITLDDLKNNFGNSSGLTELTLLNEKFDDEDNKNNENFNSLTIVKKTFEEELGLRNDAWLKILESSSDSSDVSVISPEVPVVNAWQAIMSPEIPSLNAWQIVENAIENDENEHPPSLYEYLLAKPKPSVDSLPKKHRNKINIIISKVTKYLKHNNKNLVQEALVISYIALYEKNIRFNNNNAKWEESINRVVGISNVLKDIQADEETLLCGILHDVITMYITENDNNAVDLFVPTSAFYKSQLGNIFGENVLNLSLKYSKLPKIVLTRTDYSMLQNEYQLQMLVVNADDYRTLYLRLADRIHTMRDLKVKSSFFNSFFLTF